MVSSFLALMYANDYDATLFPVSLFRALENPVKFEASIPKICNVLRPLRSWEPVTVVDHSRHTCVACLHHPIK